MLPVVYTFTRKLCYVATIAGITGSLLFSSITPTLARPADPTVVDPTTVESGEKTEAPAAEPVDAAPVEKVVVESLEKASLEAGGEINPELVEKTFANDGKAILAESVTESVVTAEARYGFNLYVQCWGDGYLHIRAFDDHGNGIPLQGGSAEYGDIATSVGCSGKFWSVQVF